jgi:acetyltransferase-like isoleucine patch superfamily enzyme
VGAAHRPGKTTLLDAFLGRAPLAGGHVTVGPSVVIGEGALVIHHAPARERPPHPPHR